MFNIFFFSVYRNAIQTLNIELFLHMLIKSEIIWRKIGQVIRLWNDMNFSETCASQMMLIFLNTLYYVYTNPSA